MTVDELLEQLDLYGWTPKAKRRPDGTALAWLSATELSRTVRHGGQVLEERREGCLPLTAELSAAWNELSAEVAERLLESDHPPSA